MREQSPNSHLPPNNSENLTSTTPTHKDDERRQGHAHTEGHLKSRCSKFFSLSLCFYLWPCGVCSSSAMCKIKDNRTCRQSFELVHVFLRVVLPSPLSGITQLLQAPSGAHGPRLSLVDAWFCVATDLPQGLFSPSSSLRFCRWHSLCTRLHTIKQQLAPNVVPIDNMGVTHPSDISVRISSPKPRSVWGRGVLVKGSFQQKTCGSVWARVYVKIHKCVSLCTDIT